MRKPRKVAIYKAMTGGKFRTSGIWFGWEFNNTVDLAPDKRRVRKEGKE